MKRSANSRMRLDSPAPPIAMRSLMGEVVSGERRYISAGGI